MTLHTILSGVVLGVCALILVAVGAILGWRSRNDEIELLEDRLQHHDEAIADLIEDGDKCDRTIRQMEEDLARERAVSDHLRATADGLRAEIGARHIGANPIWTQLGLPEPLPIDPKALRYETGTWPTIPGTVSKALELHIGEHRDGVSRQPGRHAADYRTAPTFDRREVQEMVDDARRGVPIAPEVTAVDETRPAGRTLVAVKSYPAPKQRSGKGKRR